MKDDFLPEKRNPEEYAAARRLVGLRFRHIGNQKVYRVTGVAWLGDTDSWLVLHERYGSDTVFARTYLNFTDDQQGVPRFEEVKMGYAEGMG